MLPKFSILYIYIFVSFQWASILGSLDLGTLKLVQVLFRHGDRYPIWTYPNDPYRNEPLFSPHIMGQLTEAGKRQQLELGRFLRRRYDGFIGPSYSPTEIFVMSSDMDRTIMSAQMNLAGLFEPQNLNQNCNSSIEWTPVPIRTIPSKSDKLLGMNKPCPRIREVAASIKTSSEFMAAEQEHRNFLNYLSSHTGMGEDFTFSEAAMIRDTLLIEHLNNYTLPSWIEGKMGVLDHLTGLDMMFRTSTDEAKRLRAGPLLHQILEAMKKSPKKFLMYSAHDSTLARLMGAMGLFDSIPPPYASALIFELHQEPHMGKLIQIFYRNESEREPHPLWIPGCGHPCKFEQLIKITEHLIPQDWEGECSLKSILSPFLSPVTRVFVVMGTLLASVLALVIVVLKQQKPKKKRFPSSLRFNYEAI